MNALIYAPSGGGKTVNATAVKIGERGRNLLICSDNSSIVLQNFDRPNLDVIDIYNVKDFLQAYKKGYQSKKYDTIICDNLSDVFDMWILELEESGQFKDMRQAYQLVYQSLKRLTRESTHTGCNTIFTAWCDYFEVTLADGKKINRRQPKIPIKILDNVCGLMNVVGFVGQKDGKYLYALKGSDTLIAKDQLYNRDVCEPENIFLKGDK